MEIAKKKGIVVGIVAISLMAMGVVGIAGSMAAIAGHYNVSETTISGLITIPCIVVIVATIVIGKLMEFIQKKLIAIVGAICFIIGGIAPFFVEGLLFMFVMRGLLGIGVAAAQVSMTAITAEFFDGEDRIHVQGIAQAAQMAGMCIMCICAGLLTEINWKLCFLVHLIGAASLICAVILIPGTKPDKNREGFSDVTETDSGTADGGVHITKGCFGWAVLMFLFFIGAQAYSTNLSFILEEKGIGTASASGTSLAVFAVAGLIAGILYSKVERVSKNKTIALAMLIAIVQYFVLILSKSMIVVYIGSFIGGFAVSFFMPQLFLYAGRSVNTFSIPMAVSIATCAQNLGQFACPYILNPIAYSLSPVLNLGSNVTKYYLCILIFFGCGLFMIFYGIKKDRAAVS